MNPTLRSEFLFRFQHFNCCIVCPKPTETEFEDPQVAEDQADALASLAEQLEVPRIYGVRSHGQEFDVQEEKLYEHY